ncbi:hypothetical protein [Allosalinactinospora lopnorensis]|uniref:hypothetical protein n=1 Tax=Allosalinactinospora lopnorensis TaxID=1352348 RepID=UPI000623C5DA|nr:hypothetical protein [Allosalinactinospora lopnorensis]
MFPDAERAPTVGGACVDVVRPYLLAWEQCREQERAGATQCGVAVLQNIAQQQADAKRPDDLAELATVMRRWLEVTR